MEMEVKNEKKKINQGENIALARRWKKLSQFDLAVLTKMHQTEISTLEKQELIEPSILDKISKAMTIPVDFFTDFDMEDAVKSYTNTNTNNITAAENSSEWVNSANTIEEQHNINEQKVYNYPLEELKEVYTLLIREKDKRIADLEKRVAELPSGGAKA